MLLLAAVDIFCQRPLDYLAFVPLLVRSVREGEID